MSTEWPRSILGLPSRSSLTALARNGLRVYLPKSYECFVNTNPKFLPVLENLISACVIERCSKFDIRCAYLLFVVYNDKEFSRAIYDMSPLSNFEGYSPPEFSLLNFRKVLSGCSSENLAIKLDLKNGFYHIALSNNARRYFRIKCDN